MWYENMYIQSLSVFYIVINTVVFVISTDNGICNFNSTLRNIADGISNRRYYDKEKCTVHFDTDSKRNIIVTFHSVSRQLSYEEEGRYVEIEVYDGDIKKNNAIALRRLEVRDRHFKSMSFSSRGPHMTVSYYAFKKPDAMNLEIKLDEYEKQLNDLTGEFENKQYPGLNGLSYPINAYYKIRVIPFLECSTKLHLSKLDVEKRDSIFVEFKDNRTLALSSMDYQLPPSESFAIVLDASTDTDGAQGIKGNYSVCCKSTLSSSGYVALPLDSFNGEDINSTCSFRIGSGIENVTKFSLGLNDVVNKTSSYVEIYSGFSDPHLIKTIYLSQWNGTEYFRSVSNETVIVYHAIRGNGIPTLHIVYSSGSISGNIIGVAVSTDSECSMQH